MPIVISSGLVLAEANAAIPLTHPRILYDDLCGAAGTALTASTEATGFEKENAVDYLTYDFWTPTALPATLEFEVDEARPVDYAMLAAHSLGTHAAAARWAYHNGSGWVNLTAETAPGDDRVLAFLFEEVTTSRLRLTLTGAGSMPSIGVAMAGKALAMERGLDLQNTPIILSRKTVIAPNDSEAGQWLGRSIRRQGVETSLPFSNLTAAWVREHFEPFILSARTKPFGWLESPVTYPADAAYCRCDEDIHPSHTGLPDRMNVTVNVKGLLD